MSDISDEEALNLFEELDKQNDVKQDEDREEPE